MKCPECGSKVVVVDIVRTPENEVYRRRRCNECGNQFYSVEYQIEADKQFREIWRKNHRDGHRAARENKELNDGGMENV